MKKDKNSLSVVTDDNKKALKTVKAKKVRKVKVPKQKKGVQWWKKAILVLFFLCCIVGLCGLGFVATVMMQAPPLDTTKFEFTAPTMVYDINGNEYQELEATENVNRSPSRKYRKWYSLRLSQWKTSVFIITSV